MKTSILTTLTTLSVASASSMANPWNPKPAVLGTDTLHGCYSSKIDGTVAALDFNSPGVCAKACRDAHYAVAAMQAEQCWCGDKYPANSTMVATSECNEPCPGFGSSPCGSLQPRRWTVMNTGVKVDVENAAAESSSSSVGSTFVTESPTQSSGAAQTSAGAASTTPAGSTPTAGAGRAVVGGAAVVAMGMGVLNFL